MPCACVRIHTNFLFTTTVNTPETQMGHSPHILRGKVF